MRLFSKINLVLSLLFVVLCVNDVNAQCGLGNGFMQRVATRVAQPVVNTVTYVAQNRPKPLMRFTQSVRSINYVQTSVVPTVVSVRSADCGCLNCDCVDCNCGQIRATPVATAVRNIITAVPRTIQNVRSVNVMTSNLFFVLVESVPSSVPSPEINNSVVVIDTTDLMLASI